MHERINIRQTHFLFGRYISAFHMLKNTHTYTQTNIEYCEIIYVLFVFMLMARLKIVSDELRQAKQKLEFEIARRTEIMTLRLNNIIDIYKNVIKKPFIACIWIG